MNRGAIILCGGRSSRMGSDKALLPFGQQETLLQRVVRIVAEEVTADQIVCVAAEDQQLPPLPSGVRVARDSTPMQGPLAALALGLEQFVGAADAVFACGCDTPLLSPPFLAAMFDWLGDHQVAAPKIESGVSPLPAVYRDSVLPIAKGLLAAGERSLRALIAGCDAKFIGVGELKSVDPSLAALESCNTLEEYESLLTRLKPPQ
jgi:molybdopterin-guanine dinucleotide biosynthesis protein A